MASVFTFEPDPPKVKSPWPAFSNATATAQGELKDVPSALAGMKIPLVASAGDCGVLKLDAEPQEGPIEYKLHLLLRPRRTFSATSTVQKVSGSYLSKSRSQLSRSALENLPRTNSPAPAPSSHSRQKRLQHLTTQLLWRLQQSSPHHSSSKSNLTVPLLPEVDVEQSASRGPNKLVSGLDESCGALYELGVSDDGTLVGLTVDEVEESLVVLRAMAFSLGCDVLVRRLITVGDCRWSEEVCVEGKLISCDRHENLWVAETLVSPLPSVAKNSDAATPALDVIGEAKPRRQDDKHLSSEVGSSSEQLRISLTGSTTSGKSSLLGTLSTSTLDNGRGKSRLSLLRHRHEIVSGITSSLAQELIGYQDLVSNGSASISRTNVVNYASGNVSSWNDIHSASEQGRLVFMTDSAGHPRYRRTTVRGLLSWAPHWTLCCVAADDDEHSSGKVGATASSSEILGTAGLGVDLSKAHLDFCLKLNLPLIVIITKLDLASKNGLRHTLAKVLSTLKSTGRKPAIMSASANDRDEPQLRSIAKNDEDAVIKMMASIKPSERHLLVPIVLTSAVTGSGIGRLHALLRHLPIKLDQRSETRKDVGQAAVEVQDLFHIDEVFSMPDSQTHQLANKGESTKGFILSGYLRYGSLEVGDYFSIGPCVSDSAIEVSNSPDLLLQASSYPGPVQRSPRLKALLPRLQRPSLDDFSATTDEANTLASATHVWHEVRIASLRNLRLPVRKLLAGQVGTVAIVFSNANIPVTNGSPSVANLCIRRGMVMMTAPKSSRAWLPSSYIRFSAIFQEPGLPAWPGVLVIIYTASLRTTAKIVELRAIETASFTDDVFSLDDDSESDRGSNMSELTKDQPTEITFEFVSSREWMELGTPVLVTPGGGPSLTGQPEQKESGSAGLDGYVGTITHAMV